MYIRFLCAPLKVAKASKEGDHDIAGNLALNFANGNMAITKYLFVSS